MNNFKYISFFLFQFFPFAILFLKGPHLRPRIYIWQPPDDLVRIRIWQKGTSPLHLARSSTSPLHLTSTFWPQISPNVIHLACRFRPRLYPIWHPMNDLVRIRIWHPSFQVMNCDSLLVKYVKVAKPQDKWYENTLRNYSTCTWFALALKLGIDFRHPGYLIFTLHGDQTAPHAPAPHATFPPKLG